MDKITFFKDRNQLVATFQGFVTRRVFNGLISRGFNYDRDLKMFRGPYSEEAESYLQYLDEVCRNRAKEKANRPSRPKRRPYLELFNEGLSIEDIATENNVNVITVYENLVKSVVEGKLYYQRIMDEERFQMISEYLNEEEETSSLKQLKENAPFEIEYWEIKLASSLLR